MGDKVSECHAEPRICIVQPNPCSPSETFLQAHADHLPGRVIVVVGGRMTVNDRPIKSQALVARAWRKAARIALRQGWDRELTSAYLKVFRKHRPDAVLAEYGPTGVEVRPACLEAGIPLIVHFHGYDASKRSIVEEMQVAYRDLFRDAAAIVAVSRAMRARLIALGAPEERVHWNSYGVDCAVFGGADPLVAPPVFLAVARFTEKKAPHLTLRAFAQVHNARPEAQLRMIGDGPLLNSSVELAGELGISKAVTFLGVQTPDSVRREMQLARCFVQHSVVAPDGDSEGTPVAILEASASGLPVVSTRHGGIPDVVIDGETGYLVEEQDFSGMASRMLRLVDEPYMAALLGRAAQRRARTEFAMSNQIARLWKIIEACVQPRGSPVGS